MVNSVDRRVNNGTKSAFSFLALAVSYSASVQGRPIGRPAAHTQPPHSKPRADANGVPFAIVTRLRFRRGGGPEGARRNPGKFGGRTIPDFAGLRPGYVGCFPRTRKKPLMRPFSFPYRCGFRRVLGPGLLSLRRWWLGPHGPRRPPRGIRGVRPRRRRACPCGRPGRPSAAPAGLSTGAAGQLQEIS
jgi:hypothetical protein